MELESSRTWARYLRWRVKSLVSRATLFLGCSRPRHRLTLKGVMSAMTWWRPACLGCSRTGDRLGAYREGCYGVKIARSRKPNKRQTNSVVNCNVDVGGVVTFSIIFNLEGLWRHSRIFHAIKKWTIGPVTTTISLYVIYFRKIRNEFLKYFTLRRACISRETGWRLATSFKVHGNHAGLAHRMIQLLAAVSTGVWACKP